MSLRGIFQPRPTLSDQELAHGLRMMTAEGIASIAMFSVTTSGLLAAFALALGANNLQIGILASISFLMAVLQIPAILLVEQVRRRKLIALLCWTPAQLVWFLVALIPFLVDAPSQTAVGLLIGLLAVRGALSAVTNCAWNGWIRDLVPQRILGSFFSRRMALAIIAAVIFGLAGAFFVDFWQDRSSSADDIFGYSYVILLGALLLGMSSPLFMARIPEPLMPPLSGEQPSLVQTLKAPFRDRNFRQLLNFLFFWAFASNLAIPFFTVFMLLRLDFSLPAVIGLNTLAQMTNVAFLRVWGPFADRFGSKVVLSIAVSLYLLVILGWAFTALPDRYFFTVPLVVILQLFAGVAASGVNLTVGTIGMKLAPQGGATAYMATAALATNMGAGLGPLVGGVLADFFSNRNFRISFEWTDPSGLSQFSPFSLVGFDFLFVIAFIIGLITLNTLTTIREEGEVSREIVMDELLAPTRYMTRAIGSFPGARLLGEYPYAYLRSVPGLDVALGVTAYQVASSVKSAVSAASRGTQAASGIADRVGHAVHELVERAEDVGELGVELARHAARGAIHAVEDVAEDVGELTRDSVHGVLRALSKTSIDPWDAFWEASFGAVVGAGEAREDLQTAATQAVQGARNAAVEMGLDETDAMDQAARGALAAVAILDPASLGQVVTAMEEEGVSVAQLDEPTGPRRDDNPDKE